MTFQTSRGSRGRRQPSGWLSRRVNKVVTRRMRRSGSGKIMGLNALILTTVGRRSGVERTNPVNWFPGPGGSWHIVASANAAIDNPDWYYNIAANPDKVRIEVDGRIIDVAARQLHGDERDQAWQQITAAVPRFAQYQRKTDRELPIIRLSRRADAER